MVKGRAGIFNMARSILAANVEDVDKRKRQLDDIPPGWMGNKSSGKREGGRQQMEASSNNGQELTGPDLGRGPKWDLTKAVKKARRWDLVCESVAPPHTKVLRKQSEALLLEALTCGRHADVRFQLDDGSRPVGGHKSVLSCVSSEFNRMFMSEMQEGMDGVVRTRGVGVIAVKGLLEWIYLGYAGDECRAADGRELWVLGEVFEVKGLRRWLVKYAISCGFVFSAYEFGMVPGAHGREELKLECIRRVRGGLGRVQDEHVRGVGISALRELVEAMVMYALAKDSEEGVHYGVMPSEVIYVGDHACMKRKITRASTLGILDLILRWVRVNGGWEVCDRGEVMAMLDVVDLNKLTDKDLKDFVKPSGLVAMDRLVETYEARLAVANDFVKVAVPLGGVPEEVEKERLMEIYEARLAAVPSVVGEREYGVRYTFGEELLEEVGDVAVHGKGARQRVAVVDRECVRVFSVIPQDCLITVGLEEGEGKLKMPSGCCFNVHGDLFVSDSNQDMIFVYDCDGRFIRKFGGKGAEPGKLSYPTGLACTAQGNIVVAERFNDRVQVLGPDGVPLQVILMPDREDYIGRTPHRVDVDLASGLMYVLYNNAEIGAFVLIYGPDGAYIGKRLGMRQERWGCPEYLAVGEDGMLYISDMQTSSVHVYDKDLEKVQEVRDPPKSVQVMRPQYTLGLGGASGVAVDEEGRLFVGCRRACVVKMLL